MAFQVPESYRAQGIPGFPDGVFFIPVARDRRGRPIRHAHVLASLYAGWEHVSVTLPGFFRCPTWDEMDEVRSHFWTGDDVVLQFHVPTGVKINPHRYCLHLWRQAGTDHPLPPIYLV